MDLIIVSYLTMPLGYDGYFIAVTDIYAECSQSFPENKAKDMLLNFSVTLLHSLCGNWLSTTT